MNMTQRTIVLLLLAALSAGALQGQQTTAPESKSIRDAFRHGQFGGSFRTFLMATDNARQLSDYYAVAAGGGLSFTSAPWHGFSTGIGGAFNFNLASSDLGAKDSITGASNRYEIGLFDVEDPDNRNNLARMEIFFLRYQWKKSHLTLGKQNLQTPFINYQDGRMRPTAEEGAWLELNELKKTKIEAGWLWAISPRSTVRWYDIGESVGIYPKGLNPDGSGSGYPENLHSRGVGLLGVTYAPGANTKIQVWNQFVENIFNTAFVQADYTHPLKGDHKLVGGIQFTHQNALADGGNADATKAYFLKGGQSNTLSAQAGWQNTRWQALAAYTRVSADGRFLAPREWGREPFYTFMSRERIEGSGDSHSFTGRVSWQDTRKKWRAEVAYGHFYLPDVQNHLLSKYAFPAFRQLNLDLRYTFGGMLEGLRAQVLYVWKGRIGDVYGSEKYVINKVDMSHFNLILNYTY